MRQVSFLIEQKDWLRIVSDNNHSVDQAREHALGRQFFKQLGAIKWTRATGGFIYGNNEYNEESGHDNPGGGANFRKESFGPIGEAYYQNMPGAVKKKKTVAKSKGLGM